MLKSPANGSPPTKLFRLGVLVSLVVLAIWVAACKSDYQGASRQNRADNKAARQVKVAKVEETPFGETVTANGTLAAFDQSTAGVKVAGRLNAISVDLGSVVRQGQVIAQLEPNDYKLRVQQSEAALGQARARLGLSPDGTDDRVSLEQTGTVRQAKAQLEEARLSRERAVR